MQCITTYIKWFTALALGLPLTVAAQGLSAEDILDRAQTQSERIDEVLALLDHQDPNVRIVALGQMVTEGSDHERRLALQHAFVSGDPALRHTAIKHRLQEMPELPITLSVPRESRDSVPEAVLEGFSTDLTYTAPVEMGEVDFRTGQFTVQHGYQSVINGDDVSIAFRPGRLYHPLLGSCRADVTLRPDLSLTGVTRCDNLRPPLDTSIQLF